LLEGENRRKVRKLRDQDNDSLIGKAKAMRARKARRIHLLLPLGRQMLSHFLGSRTSSVRLV